MYETDISTKVLPETTVLIDGVTPIMLLRPDDNCESLRTAITVKLVSCGRYINPNQRLKVKR